MEKCLEAILQSANQAQSARFFVKQLQAKGFSPERSEINRLLYSWAKIKKVVRFDGTPPTWEISDQAEQCCNAVSDPKLHRHIVVAVDLGNVHDVLQPLDRYVGQILECKNREPEDILIVRAFADTAFNGFGVNPPCKNIQTRQSSSGHKNEADIALVWWLAGICSHYHQAKIPLEVYIASKDQGFRSVQQQVDVYPGNKCKFVNRWEELREFIE